MVLAISYLEVVFFQVQNIVILILWVLFLGIKVYAFVDCVRRPAQAFAAVGRQSKSLWLILTGISALAGLIFQDPLGLFGIAGLVASLVYLFDVRPRIQEILINRW